ncbi:MAG: alkaline phosphatase family protein [Clostridia bacterium]|nr:alkaline phosphatase family protein [Clostridia bacterium]
MSYTYKRAILLGVDGAGIFFKDADTPEMDRIFKDGATSYDVMTAIPTISAECWGSMLIGSSAQAHKLTNSIVGAKHYDEDSPIPSVFKRVRKALPDAALASFCNWDPINNGIIEQSLGVTFGTGEDEAVCDQICKYLDENDPTLLFAQFDSVDGAGHGNGYGTPNHLAQITVVDTLIGKIYDKLEERGMLEDTLLMVIADHGGTPYGSHGGNTDAEKIVFFGAVGKTVKAGTIGEMNVRDSAAIIMYALGLPVPEFNFGGFSGQVPAGLFEDYTPAERQDIYSAPNNRPNLPTPEKDSGKYLTDYICGCRIAAYLPFDSNAADALGKTAVEVVGKPKYYGIGVYGDCIEVGCQGHLTLPDVKLGTDSFTVSLWIFVDGAVWCELPVLGTKKWSGDSTNGCTLVYANYGISFNVGNGDDEEKFHFNYPDNMEWGWNNITVSVDRKAGKITGYYNFKDPVVQEIPECIRNTDMDSAPFTVGQDAAGDNNRHFNYKLDDLVIFGDALTAEDIAKLGKYYGE